jgi:hypothetical protein
VAAGFVVIVVLALPVGGMTVALARLSASYDQLIARSSGERRPAWLRSLRAEGGKERATQAVGITALERIVMLSVSEAVIALLVRLSAFAHSSLPSK